MRKSIEKKTIALVQGDPAGIGPELLVNLMLQQDVRDAANLVLIGDRKILARGEKQVGKKIHNVRSIKENEPMMFNCEEVLHIDVSIDGITNVAVGQVSREGGLSSILALKKSLELSKDGIVDGIVFLPFNKESMHMGGNNFTDELGYASDFFDLKTRVSEFNVAEGIWNGRVTSHVAMKDVSKLLTVNRIDESIVLAHQTLSMAGYANPRIVVAAYNPHAGDGGLMGDEEIRVIRPAVKLARSKGLNVDGPFPADTLWLKVKDGKYDVVVTMYHDQGQIAIKLLGFDKGVSVLAGLPIPLTTPAHGTAFDITGLNIANIIPTQNAFFMCLEMAKNLDGTKKISKSRNAVAV